MARTHGHGNPDWSRDETILALNLYCECDGTLPSRNDTRVIELSNVLRNSPFHDLASRKETFRNPAGVAFKLQNIRNVATGRGLANVSDTDRAVWSEFGGSPDAVAHLARLIREGAQLIKMLPAAADADDAIEFNEGRILTILHRTRERAPGIRRRLLAKRFVRGRLACEMCNRPSLARDRKFEAASFEVHHILPIAQSLERTTRLSDVALLCACCHRLLHRAIAERKQWIGIEEGKSLIEMERSSARPDH